MLPKQKIMTDAQQGGGEEEEDDGSAVVVRRLPRPASACRNNVGVCPKKYNYQVLLHHARMKAKASAFEKTLPSCLVWQESGTKYVSFFFFSCFIEWVTEGREGGRLFVRGEDGAREEVCGGENKLVQGKRDKSVTTATGRHTGKEEGAWGERVERTTTVSGRMRQARKKE